MAALLAVANPSAIASVTTLIDNGDPLNRVDVVFLGDGYTQTNIDNGVYDAHVQNYVEYQFSDTNAQGNPTALADPFPRYKNFFNVHQVEVVSNESGADRTSLGIFRDTALDATYETRGIDRLLTVNSGKAFAAMDAALAGTDITGDMRYVTINDAHYGGGGGSWAMFAGANPNAFEVALHEVGHSFSGLADEYVSFFEPFPNTFEPHQVNVTLDPTGAKWERWLGFDDPRGGFLDIGVHEGARYYETGVYRPSPNSKMRSLGVSFDAVSREKIILDIYQRVDPVDEHLDNTLELFDPTELWIEVIDPDVILIEWTVDGILTAVTDEMFDLAGLEIGNHTIEAHAYDGVLDHAFDGSLLDLVRKDFSLLEQTIAWSVTISVPEPSTVFLAITAMLLVGRRGRIDSC